MTVADSFGAWADNTFTALPGTTDEIFQKLWGEGRFRFGGSAERFDLVDERSARLVSAAVTRRRSLFIGLPDDHPHRPAALLGMALLRYWGNSCFSGATGRRSPTVLYFGTTTGIREQLRQVSVHGLGISLAEALGQCDLTRGGRDQLGRSPSRTLSISNSLPRVVTVYAPADPAVVLDQYGPQWIAVDCDDAATAGWLAPLLAAATRRSIPVVGWGHNPLSECVAEFARAGIGVFSWPHSLGRPQQSRSSRPSTASLLLPGTRTALTPTVLQGGDVDRLLTVWSKAARLLARAARRAAGPHAQEVVRVHWRYLHALEQLMVPFGLHEAEAPRLWGLHSFHDLRDACEVFCQSLTGDDRELGLDLRQAQLDLVESAELLREGEAPLWTALYGMTIDTPPSGEARLITFGSWARKQLFLFALLAEIGMSEDDLLAQRTCVVCLQDLLHLQHRLRSSIDPDDPLTSHLDRLLTEPGIKGRPVFVGVPGASTTPKLMPLLMYEDIDMLLYPHQTTLLEQRSEVLGQALDGLHRTLGTLSLLAGRPTPRLSNPPARVRLRPPTGLEAKRSRRTEARPVPAPWETESPSELITRLLAADDDEEIRVPIDRAAVDEANRRDGGVALCGEAIELRCDSGWMVRLPPDETINVIVHVGSGVQVQERLVRSLRPGDRVLLIHGHKRQSLYDLILSRLHSRPNMELHLALVRQWYIEFGLAFERWHRQGKTLEDLLSALRQRGSEITSPDTLKSWLRGYILCPFDPADLGRLAEVLDIDFLRAHHARVHTAAAQLRSLHRSLSLRLNRWLERQAAGLVYGADDEPVDPQHGLGLTFGDFRSSILVTEVRAIRKVPGPFFRNALGSVEREVPA